MESQMWKTRPLGRAVANWWTSLSQTTLTLSDSSSSLVREGVDCKPHERCLREEATQRRSKPFYGRSTIRAD